MRRRSLRRRVVVWSTAVLAVLLLGVGIGVDVALGAQLRADQRDRLESLAALSTELRPSLDDQELADRLSMPGITAQIRDTSGDGGVVVGVPSPPPAGSAPGEPPARRGARPDAGTAASDVTISQRGGAMVATLDLGGGRQLLLISDTGSIDSALARFRLLMTVASVIGLVVAAGSLWWIAGRALRPLDDLTRAARATTHGARGRRVGAGAADTELGRAAHAFDEMLEELESHEAAADEANRRLSRFLSDASHELRTPLAGISAGSERLLRERLQGDDADQVLVGIIREARRAARLVDDLLATSRLDELALQREPVPLADLARTAAVRSESIGAPAVEVVAETDDPGSLTVPADRGRVEQVLDNLLSNGRRAAHGALRIRLSPSADTVALVVSDDGDGVPPEARNAVFERLVRLGPAASTAGAGLGLPIARTLVEAHGGTLTCIAPTAADLPGAAFRLELPREPAAGPAGSSGGTAGGASGGAGPHREPASQAPAPLILGTP